MQTLRNANCNYNLCSGVSSSEEDENWDMKKGQRSFSVVACKVCHCTLWSYTSLQRLADPAHILNLTAPEAMSEIVRAILA